MLGLIASVAAFTFLELHWADLDGMNAVLSRAALFVGLDAARLIAALAAPATRISWIVSVLAIVFAWFMLITLLTAGIVETAIVRKRLGALRHDPILQGKWNEADWRAVFARSAVADRADAIVAAIVPPVNGSGRRIVTNTEILSGLGDLWLARLTMAATITPLPVLLIGLSGTLALLRHSESGEWEITLAAGVAGAFLIQLAFYLVRSALSFSVALTIRVATAAIRPLISSQWLDTALRPAVESPTPPAAVAAKPSDKDQMNAFAIGKALASVLLEPLNKLTEAADRFSLSAINRDREIDTALAEVRAKIERLLAGSLSGED